MLRCSASQRASVVNVRRDNNFEPRRRESRISGTLPGISATTQPLPQSSAGIGLTSKRPITQPPRADPMASPSGRMGVNSSGDHLQPTRRVSHLSTLESKSTDIYCRRNSVRERSSAFLGPQAAPENGGSAATLTAAHPPLPSAAPLVQMCGTQIAPKRPNRTQPNATPVRTATASTTGWHGTAPHRKGNSQDAPSSRPSPPEGSSHHRTTRCSPIPTGFSEHRVAARVPGLGNGPHARTARRATGRHSFTGVYPCGIPAFATVPPCLRGLLARLDSHASLHLPPRCRGSGPPEEGPPTIRNG